MNLDVAVIDGAELDASNDGDPIGGASGAGRGDARNGIVIGDRDRRETDRRGLGD
jgi:hypothetical protein